jgi:SpoVK/Ycf46/Vps4 family AAA+-type ATPase
LARIDSAVLHQLAGTPSRLIEEHRRTDLLRSHNLEPRHRVLLVGSPGNGKTSIAEAIANELAVPLFV